MVMSIARFNMSCPGINPEQVSDTYKAALDIAEYIDRHGFAMATLDEHHGANDGWMTSTLVTAGMLLARTRTMNVALYALLLPLHDPLRVAEDIAVLDLASGGRLSPVVLGLGYRPEEYAMFAKDWSNRGQLFDECVDALLKAWTGEPFEFRGRHRAGHADATDQAPSGRWHWRHLEGRRPPRRPIRSTVPAGSHRSGPRRLLLRAVRRVGRRGVLHGARRGHRHAPRRGGP